MENQQLLIHDNAPAHRSVLVKDFVAKNNVTTLEHLRYSPDLASADIYLFPRLRSALKGRRLCDATVIIKNATEELKRLTKWLPGMFPTALLSLAAVYFCKTDCLEGNVAQMIVLFCISQK
jgi:hypothetical protein